MTTHNDVTASDGSSAETATGCRATPDETASPELPWDDLVTAALLGAERRTPPGGSVAALLDLAVVQTVRRRAGLLPAKSGALPEPAPEDNRRALPPAAANRLDQLLSHASRSSSAGRSDHFGREFSQLLPEWLTIANSFSYKVPPAQLAALLDIAKARSDLRGQALAFAGPRALWLARLNPDWRYVLRGAAPVPSGRRGRAPVRTPAGSDTNTAGWLEPERPEDEAEAQAIWEEGLFAERVALLSAVRRSDAAAGLRLLSTTWSTERAEDRLMFLGALRNELSLADEPFLEVALGDRSKNVRSIAAELLSTLPQSALARRMSERARSCVTLDPPVSRAAKGSHPGRLVVDPPYEWDVEMRRDCVVSEPPTNRGQRAWWLAQTVEATPLEDWSAHLGGCTPEQLVQLPVVDGWRDDLRGAWVSAAINQRDVEWARVLLGEPGKQGARASDTAQLLGVLPDAERTAWAAQFIAAHGLSNASRILAACTAPWSTELAHAVVDALEITQEAKSYPWSLNQVLGLTELSLDPALAERLVPLTTRHGEGERDTPGASAYWFDAFDRLVLTLRTRALMREELEAG